VDRLTKLILVLAAGVIIGCAAGLLKLIFRSGKSDYKI